MVKARDRYNRQSTKKTTKNQQKSTKNQPKIKRKSTKMLKIVIIIAVILTINLIAADDDLNQLYCHLNEFAKQRVENNLPVFPCQ